MKTIPYFDPAKFRLMTCKEYSTYYDELKQHKAPILDYGLLGPRRPKDVSVTLLVMECQLLDKYALVRFVDKDGVEMTMAINPTEEHRAAPFSVNINRYFERFFVEDSCAIQENQRGSEKTLRGSFGKPFNCLYSITAHGVITCQLSKESVQCMLTGLLALETLIQRVEQVHGPESHPFIVRHARVATMQATCDFGIKADIQALKFWNPWNTKEYTHSTTSGKPATRAAVSDLDLNSRLMQNPYVNNGAHSNIVYYTAKSDMFAATCTPRPPFFVVADDVRNQVEKDMLFGNMRPVSPTAGLVNKEDRLPCRPTTLSTVYMAQQGKSTVSCINSTSWIECLAGFTELYEQVAACEYIRELIMPALIEARQYIITCEEPIHQMINRDNLCRLLSDHVYNSFNPTWSSCVVFSAAADKLNADHAMKLQELAMSTLRNSFYVCEQHDRGRHCSTGLFNGLEMNLKDRVNAELKIQEEYRAKMANDSGHDVKKRKLAMPTLRQSNLRPRFSPKDASNESKATQQRNRVVYKNTMPKALDADEFYGSLAKEPDAGQSSGVSHPPQCSKCIMGLLLLHLPYTRKDDIHFKEKVQGVTDNMWLYLETK